MRPDAVVIGAGPNGLVAANLLADAGWEVLVLEAEDTPGGAVRSAEVTAPGFVTDLYSAFYPLGAASPVIAGLGLAAHGLRWRHAPLVLAHPLDDGRCAVLSRDVDVTAASLDAFAAGDGDAWRRLHAAWLRIGDALLDALVTPFPPLRPGVRLLRTLGVAGAVRTARFGLLPVRRFAEERFRGAGGGLLLAGNALHTDLGPEAAGSAVFGWLLAMLGQTVGFPVPEGGAGRLSAALVRRLEAAGGQVACGTPVTAVVVRDGRAVGVRTADGRAVAVHRAVLADVAAPLLFRDLVGEEHLPRRFVADLRRFQWDHATFKVNWALSGPVPWRAGGPARAGTVHLGGGLDALTRYAAALAAGRIPAAPYLVLGQMTTADPTRSPRGTESVWAYTHLPREVRGDDGGTLTGRWDDAEAAAFADRVEAQIERYAPGFRDLVIARHLQPPPRLEAGDANLVLGAVNGGTAAPHQELIFRPTPGLGRPETPIRGLFLASASAHPGGGVHGGPGANAARVALAQARSGGRAREAAAQWAQRLIHGD